MLYVHLVCAGTYKYEIKSDSPLRRRDSSVGTVSRYGLDGPRIESQSGQIFRTRPDRPWGPPSPSVQ
jgi:hypothetical protein